MDNSEILNMRKLRLEIYKVHQKGPDLFWTEEGQYRRDPDTDKMVFTPWSELDLDDLP